MRLAELQQALKAADPAAVLVAPRIMDRLLQRITHHTTFFTDLPHRESLVVSRPLLYRHVDPDELDIEPERLLPEVVLLLARPSPNTMTTQDRETILLTYWRRLFHASVHRELDRLRHDNRLTAADIAERISHLTPGELAEARMVLRQEHYLRPDADDEAVYLEFAAAYLELRYFAANLVPVWFPSIPDPDRIDRLLARDIDAAALFHRTRLPGAPDPVVRTDTKSDESHDYYRRLMNTAERADREGNTVRAAIIRTRAARVAPAALTNSTRQDARADLRRLTQRLQAALELTDPEAEEWLKDLPALLDKADQGHNPSEAALLFDLQKIGIDHERDMYTLDVVEWLLSGGRRPIKRPLPSQRLVRITKHLRSAAARLTQARLSDEDRSHLARLLQTALQRCEDRLRACFRPVLQDALSAAGIHASNLPERTAGAKMIEEMLDRVTEVGFFTFSDLRDIISRNQLKMADLTDAHEFMLGDALARLDRRLATALDGVYRPGEFYLRWLERCTSPAFGTRLGRWLTMFLVVPVLAAVMLLDGAQVVLDHTARQFWDDLPVFAPIGWLQQQPVQGKWASVATALLATSGTSPDGLPLGPGNQAMNVAWSLRAVEALNGKQSLERPRLVAELSTMLVTFGITSLAVIALLHSAQLRRRVGQGLRLLWLVARGTFYDFPRWLFRLPVVRQLWDSWFFHLFVSFVLQPLGAWCLLVWWFPEAFGQWVSGIMTFLACNLAMNSRLGRELTNGIIQALSDFWELLQAGLVSGLIRLIISLLKWLMDGLEYVLFTVDEWLRFRSGDSQVAMVVRAVATVLWYPVAFLLRFYLVVLIEPFLHPLKSPMTVLVAKFMAPIVLVMGYWLHGALQPVLGALAFPVAWLTAILSPDAIVFLIWEMKENWGLYRANRRRTLQPVNVGPSGETVRRLLDPGVYSGTVPRLFARLRRAEREGLQTGNWRAARTYRQAVERVEKSLKRLVEREALTLAQLGPAWEGVELGVGRVSLTPRRARLELTHKGHPDSPVVLEWQMDGEYLVASIVKPGWLSCVSEAQREAMVAVLAGLYKLAGIDIVREQVRANVPLVAADFDIVGSNLTLWQAGGQRPAVLYDLDTPRGPITPRPALGVAAEQWPPLEPSRVLYNRRPLTWKRWVARWEIADGKPAPPLFTPPVALLPGGTGA
jgi:hypothetical protein